MRVKTVTFTEEHVIFLWKNFRYLSPENAKRHFDIFLVNSSGACVEIRNLYGSVIACGIIKYNCLSYAAVDEVYRGSGLQRKLIKAREKLIKAKNGDFDRIEITIRCKNIPSIINALKCGYRIEGLFRYENDDEGYLLTKKTKDVK